MAPIQASLAPARRGAPLDALPARARGRVVRVWVCVDALPPAACFSLPRASTAPSCFSVLWGRCALPPRRPRLPPRRVWLVVPSPPPPLPSTSRQPPPVYGGREAPRVASSRCTATTPPWTCPCSSERRRRGGPPVWGVCRRGRRCWRARRRRTVSPPTPANLPAPTRGEVGPAAAWGGSPPATTAVHPWWRRATPTAPAAPPVGAAARRGWRVWRPPAASVHANTPSGGAAPWRAPAAACPTAAAGGGGGSGGAAAAAAAATGGSGTAAAAPTVGDAPAAAAHAAAAEDAVSPAGRAATHLFGAAEPDRAATAGARFPKLHPGAAATITTLSVQPTAAKHAVHEPTAKLPSLPRPLLPAADDVRCSAAGCGRATAGGTAGGEAGASGADDCGSHDA